jgi:hypothetical protein
VPLIAGAPDKKVGEGQFRCPGLVFPKKIANDVLVFETERPELGKSRDLRYYKIILRR